MNFMWNGPLADLQQKTFEQYLQGNLPSPEVIKLLKNNIMVKLAAYLAPDNLVVRHYCVLDLVTDFSNNEENIKKQCYKISMYKEGKGDLNKCLWREGCSYWGYTRLMLKKYVEVFKSDWGSFIDIMDLNFKRTAYLNEGEWYPAPFGDLWDIPLEYLQQQSTDMPTEKIGPVTKSNPTTYLIEEEPLGFNLHTRKNKVAYSTLAGVPLNKETGAPFKFYKGYKEKFPTVWSEIKEMISLSRFLYFFK